MTSRLRRAGAGVLLRPALVVELAGRRLALLLVVVRRGPLAAVRAPVPRVATLLPSVLHVTSLISDRPEYPATDRAGYSALEPRHTGESPAEKMTMRPRAAEERQGHHAPSRRNAGAAIGTSAVGYHPSFDLSLLPSKSARANIEHTQRGHADRGTLGRLVDEHTSLSPSRARANRRRSTSGLPRQLQASSGWNPERWTDAAPATSRRPGPRHTNWRQHELLA